MLTSPHNRMTFVVVCGVCVENAFLILIWLLSFEITFASVGCAQVFIVFRILQVGWVKADTKAIQAIHEHVITHNPRVTVSHSDLNTWNLHIKSVAEDDRGGYMCQLNTDPMKSGVSSQIFSHISNENAGKQNQSTHISQSNLITLKIIMH